MSWLEQLLSAGLDRYAEPMNWQLAPAAKAWAGSIITALGAFLGSLVTATADNSGITLNELLVALTAALLAAGGVWFTVYGVSNAPAQSGPTAHAPPIPWRTAENAIPVESGTPPVAPGQHAAP